MPYGSQHQRPQCISPVILFMALMLSIWEHTSHAYEQPACPSPVVSIEANPESASEGTADHNVQFRVSLTCPMINQVLVYYTISSANATLNSDYTIPSQANPLVFVWGGPLYKDITVTVKHDTAPENTESIKVRIDSVVAATIDTANREAFHDILDNDMATFSISAAAASGREKITPAQFTISHAPPLTGSQTASVWWRTENGTATAGSDFTGNSGTVLNFNAQTNSITVSAGITDDSADEGDESFTAVLYNSSGPVLSPGSASYMILANDPKVFWSLSEAAVNEGVAATPQLKLSRTVSYDVLVTYTLSGGTAVPPGDYPSSYNGTFAATILQNTLTKDLTVPTNTDTVDEAQETLPANIAAQSGIDGAEPGSGGAQPTLHTIQINDLNAVPTLNLTSDGWVEEGEVLTTYTATLSHLSEMGAWFAYQTFDNTATAAGEDYQTTNGLVTFGSTELTKKVYVQVYEDTRDEDTEHVGVLITNSQHVNAQSGSGLAEIRDDDPPPVISVVGPGQPVSETDSDATFTLSLDRPSAFSVTVTAATENETATAGLDYNSTSTQVTLSPGETVKTVLVRIKSDFVDEADETFRLRLSNPNPTNRITLAANPSDDCTIADDGQGIPTSGLKVWLMPDSLTTGALATWIDSSGNNNHATQATATNKPSVVTGVINGLPVVQFDGSDDYMGLPNNLLTGSTAGDAFVVLKADVAVPAGHRGLWTLGTTGGSYYPTVTGQVVDTFGCTARTVGVPGLPINNFQIYNPTSQAGQWISRMNGLIQHAAYSNTVSFGTGVYRIGPGLYNYTTAFMFDGDIAEVIIYNRVLTDAEREQALNYLSRKYAITPATAPASPTAAMAHAVSAQQVSVTWKAAVVGYQVFYEIERKTGAGSFSKVGEVANSLSWLDTSVTAGQQYTYRIRARTGSGTSGYSSDAVVVSLSEHFAILPVADVALWLRADSHMSTGTKNFWQDQSAFNRDGAQITATNHPVLAENVVNGLPVVRFDGSDDYLSMPPACLSSLSEGEAFVIIKADSAVPPADRGLWVMGSSSHAYFPFRTGEVRDHFGSSVTYNTGYSTQPVTNFNVYGVSSKINQWRSRFNYLTQYTATGTWPYFGSGGYSIGQGIYNYTTSYMFDGDIAEVLIFKRVLSESERATVWSYFVGKYGANDSDGDGLMDSWETARFGNLNQTGSGDADGDLLLNYEEFLMSANPNVSDSDGDGLSDYNEVHVTLSDPWTTDTDGDGLADNVEVANGLTPRTKDAHLDPDKDGLSNADEIEMSALFGFTSNRLDPDTNDDGILDSIAFRTGVDPARVDYDLDGQSGSTEIANGTSTLLADTDKDGVADPSDAFPHDPARSTAPTVAPGDTTPPAVTIASPRNAAY